MLRSGSSTAQTLIFPFVFNPFFDLSCVEEGSWSLGVVEPLGTRREGKAQDQGPKSQMEHVGDRKVPPRLASRLGGIPCWLWVL